VSIPIFVISVLTVAGALAAMTLKNTIHCVLALTVAFAGVALLFLGLDAQFVGFAQILVYIGAVVILVVFAVLLTRSSETPEEGSHSRTWFTGLAISAGVFAVLGWAVLASVNGLPNETAAPDVNVHKIGNALMGRYVLPLEIVALLLTAATIGAVIVAMHEKARTK